MPFAIKAAVGDLHAATLAFPGQKTMYGGKRIATGDIVFIVASENEGGRGLAALRVVVTANAIPLQRDVARQTPRVSLVVKRLALAHRPLGRAELRSFTDWKDGRPQTELDFKLYRQATNKIIGISDETATFLGQFF